MAKSRAKPKTKSAEVQSGGRGAQLANACALVNSGAHQEALGALLTVWRSRPLERLAGLIGELDARLGADGALGVLKGETMAATAERVRELAARGRDPRLASALLELVREAPYTSDASRPTWQLIFETLVEMADPRSVAALEEVRRAGWGIRKTQRAWLDARCAHAIEALRDERRAALVTPTAEEAAALEDLAKALAASATPAPRGTARTLDELFAEVYAHPDDDAPRAVLADFLQARGDPRGELIALQLRPELDARARARLEELLAEPERSWLGPLDPVLTKSGLEFARGFPVACRTTFRREADVRAHGSHAAWATIERLSHVVPSPLPPDQARFVFWIDPAMSSLREVDVHEASLDCLTQASRPWRIERLDARAVRDRDALDALASTDKLPELRALVLRDPPRGFVPRMKGATSLRELVLDSGQSNLDWPVVLSQVEGLSGIEKLVFRLQLEARIELHRGADGELSRAVCFEHPMRLELLAQALEGLGETALTELVLRRVPSAKSKVALSDRTRVALVEAAARQRRLGAIDLTDFGDRAPTPLERDPSAARPVATSAASQPAPSSERLRAVSALVWPDEANLLVHDDERVVRMELASPESLTTLYDSATNLLAASGRSGLFAVVDGGRALVADFTGARRHRLDAHVGNGKRLAFSADGQRLLTASGDSNDRFLRLWDLRSGACISERPIPDRTAGVVWLADEAHVLISRVFDKPLLAPLDPRGRGRAAALDVTAFWGGVAAPSGRFALAARGEIIVAQADATGSTTAPTLRAIARYKLDDDLRGYAFVKGDRLVYLDGPRLVLANESTTQTLREEGSLTCLAVSPSGERLALGHVDRVELLDVP
ncbi:MAG: TIGR02996 domain-containing protein [Polyangiaceae bacterium]